MVLDHNRDSRVFENCLVSARKEKFMEKCQVSSTCIEKVYVRPIPLSYENCIRSDPSLMIDLSLAKKQWQSYVSTIQQAGIQVSILPQEDRLPDSAFIEDTAVVMDHQSLVITEPGHPQRRPETEGVRRFLGSDMTIIPSVQGATIDGGDVLRFGQKLFVGLSGRTSPKGVSFIRGVAKRFGIEVIEVNVPSGLHLKSSLSLLDQSTIIIYPESEIDLEPFEKAGLKIIETREVTGANIVDLGDKRIMVAASAKETRTMLDDMGYKIFPINISELSKADAALTCLSIRVPFSGKWCS